MKIVILPIGHVESSVLERVQENLGKIIPRTEVSILSVSMLLPKEAFNERREQYNSSDMLALIREYVNKTTADRILGITDADLYVPQLNFVFGEAERPGKAALISLHRLKPEFYGNSADKTLFHERAVKEAVHEIGHTIGLTHCPDSSCMMFFSNTISDVDRKKRDPCQKCLRQLLKFVQH